MDSSERGMAYLNRIRQAGDASAKLAVVGEIQRDGAIGVDELSSLVAILGNGRYEARGTRPDLMAKLRDAVSR